MTTLSKSYCIPTLTFCVIIKSYSLINCPLYIESLWSSISLGDNLFKSDICLGQLANVRRAILSKINTKYSIRKGIFYSVGKNRKVFQKEIFWIKGKGCCRQSGQWSKGSEVGNSIDTFRKLGGDENGWSAGSKQGGEVLRKETGGKGGFWITWNPWYFIGEFQL